MKAINSLIAVDAQDWLDLVLLAGKRSNRELVRFARGNATVWFGFVHLNMFADSDGLLGVQTVLICCVDCVVISELCVEVDRKHESVFVVELLVELLQ